MFSSQSLVRVLRDPDPPHRGQRGGPLPDLSASLLPALPTRELKDQSARIDPAPPPSLFNKITHRLGNTSGPFVAGIGSTIATTVSSPIGSFALGFLAIWGLVNEKISKSRAATGSQSVATPPSHSLSWFARSPGINSSLSGLAFLWSAVEAVARFGPSALPLAATYFAATIGLFAVARATNIQNNFPPPPSGSLLQKAFSVFNSWCPKNLATVLKDNGPWFAICNLGMNLLFLKNIAAAVTLTSAVPTLAALCGAVILAHAAWIGIQPLFGKPHRAGHSSIMTGTGDFGVAIGSLFLGSKIMGIATLFYCVSNLLLGHQAKTRINPDTVSHPKDKN